MGRFAAVGALVVALQAVSADESVARLKADVEALVGFGGRLWGSDEGVASSAWLAETFAEIGLEPAGTDGWFQPLPEKGRNVIGWLPPTGDAAGGSEYVLIGAHFDHLGWRDGVPLVGADDNATGVAALLETARQLAAAPHRPGGVLFVGFDAEEFGLAGSRHLAASPVRSLEDCRAMICLDILGRSLLDCMPGEIFAFGSEWSRGMRTALGEAARMTGSDVLSLGAEYIGPRSDFFYFSLRRVPFVFLTTGTHADYHQTSDTADRVDYGSLAKHTRLITALVGELLDGAKPEFGPHEPDLEAEAKTVLHVSDRMLAKDLGFDQAKLDQIDRLRQLASRIEAGESVGVLPRTRLVVRTQLLLITTGSLEGMDERLRRVLEGF